jgi:hypothetical protein
MRLYMRWTDGCSSEDRREEESKLDMSIDGLSLINKKSPSVMVI